MEMSVVISITGIPDYPSMDELDYDEAKQALTDSPLAIEEGEPGETEYNYLADEQDYPPGSLDPESFWGHWKKEARELRASGIIEREAFDTLMNDLRAFFETSQTMGTLGGPLSGGMPYLVADISFRFESSILIECIRVTPIPMNRKGEPFKGDSRTWDRLARAMESVY